MKTMPMLTTLPMTLTLTFATFTGYPRHFSKIINHTIKKGSIRSLSPSSLALLLYTVPNHHGGTTFLQLMGFRWLARSHLAPSVRAIR
ncbi:hypothetical protein BX600DRAFT_452163 [Xylariales sp. PMI_506]|nr:hypothetical protein BX600DRAFT_452163 [Xylariales sp. PMI_506]